MPQSASLRLAWWTMLFRTYGLHYSVSRVFGLDCLAVYAYPAASVEVPTSAMQNKGRPVVKRGTRFLNYL